MFRHKRFSTALICFSLFAWSLVPRLWPQESASGPGSLPAATEELLGELSPHTEVPGPDIARGNAVKEFFVSFSPRREADYQFDPGSLRFVARAKQGGKWVLVVDGKEQGEFDGIEAILISPYGEHVVYSAKRAGKWVKMMDDKEIGPGFDKLGEGIWLFGENGLKRYAYPAKRGHKCLMVADGKEGAEFQDVSPPYFSRNGQRLAYEALEGTLETGPRWLMVVDGEKGPVFQEVSPAVFSRDGQHVAYRGKREGNREVLLVDGKETMESQYEGAEAVPGFFNTMQFDYVGQPVFSPDGQHMAYRAKHKRKHEVIIVDGKEGPEFEEIGRPIFSPDGQHLAYRAKRDNKYEVVVMDGKEGPEFEELGRVFFDYYRNPDVAAFNAGDMSNPVYSPDGGRLAYFGRRAKKWRMVVDGQEGPEFEAKIFSGPLFTEDGRHVACVALKGLGKALEVRDGKTSAEIKADFPKLNAEGSFIESPVLSPDGQRLAYILGSGGRAFWRGGLTYFRTSTTRAHRRVVIDGKVGEDYDTLGIAVMFSPDSRHIICAVRGGVEKDRSAMVIDGKEGKLYDDLIGWALGEAEGGASSGHALVYIAREGRKFYRVTQPLP